MGIPIKFENEQRVTVAFNKQSLVFDDQYAGNLIIQYKRKRVREHLIKHLNPGGSILEINAGTGEDAIFLAQQGYHIHATDISPGMQSRLKQKLIGRHLVGSVSQEICSFTELKDLKNKGPYDCIFSNFAGLNCTAHLEQVLGSFDSLMKPGGIVTMVILPPFCLWESLLMFKGKFRTAFRRFFSSKGRHAQIDGLPFTCWYYSAGFVKRLLRSNYNLIEMEGLCTIVPPSYIEKFPENHPIIYSYLRSVENRLKNRWPWKYIGDYYIISFRKK